MLAQKRQWYCNTNVDDNSNKKNGMLKIILIIIYPSSEKQSSHDNPTWQCNLNVNRKNTRKTCHPYN